MNKFTEKAFLQFFGPSLVVGIGLAISNVIDSVAVGNELGEAGLAAIGYSIPIFMLADAIFVALGVGGSVQFSKLAGAGENKKAERISSIILETSILIGLIIGTLGLIFTPEIVRLLGCDPSMNEVFALSVSYCRISFASLPVFFFNAALYYLVRSDDQEKFAGMAYFIGTILDVILNVLLVTVLKLGINGSAYATLIGQSLSIAFLLGHLAHKNRVISFKLFAIDWKEVLDCLKIGFSSSNQYISYFIFVLLVNHILAGFAGSSGVAVFDVVLNLSYLARIFIDASSDSLIPLAGTLFGERNFPELHRMFKLSMLIGIAVSAVYLLILGIIASPLCMLFGLSNPDTLALGIVAARLYCLSALFSGVCIIAGSYYQATGRENVTYLLSFFKGYIFLISFTLLFSFTDAYTFWWSLPLADVCSAILVLILRKMKRFSSSNIVSPDRFYTVRFDHNLSNLSKALTNIEDLCDRFAISPKQSIFIMNALEEVSVAIRDNTPLDKAASFYIIVTVVFEENGDVRFCIRDSATAYNPFEQNSRRLSADNLDDADVISGLGIMMVKNKAKEFNYRRYLNFNTLIVII